MSQSFRTPFPERRGAVPELLVYSWKQTAGTKCAHRTATVSGEADLHKNIPTTYFVKIFFGTFSFTQSFY